MLQEEPKSYAIIPSEAEISEVKEELIPFFKETVEFSHIADIKADEIINDAKKGWARAPKTFRGRVDRLIQLRLNAKIFKGQTAIKRKYIEKKNRELIDGRKYNGKLTDAIFNELSKEEQNYWLERERFYFQEFEFNRSSDFSPLVSLIADEILMQRLKARQFKSTEDLSKQLTECQNRIINVQKILGITKAQRDVDDHRKDGSVSDISNDVDAKLELRKKTKLIEEKKIEDIIVKKENIDTEYRGMVTVNTIRDSDVQKLVEGM